MILIDSMYYQDTKVMFYNGIDFSKLLTHSKDGSDGFIYLFIENWVEEVKSYNRNLKLESIINNLDFNEFNWDLIDNNYVCVYQTQGVGVDVVYDTIRKKLENDQFPDQPWIPMASGKTGAWKISNNQNEN